MRNIYLDERLAAELVARRLADAERRRLVALAAGHRRSRPAPARDGEALALLGALGRLTAGLRRGVP